MTTVIATGRTVTIGKTEYRIEQHRDDFYGEYWGAVSARTGRPHAMRDTQAEAEADLDSLVKAQSDWEKL